jgi:branched-chain amino acid transport system ATP-binding protein
VTDTALELRAVSSGYEHTTILRDVSLSVRKSSVVALLGPNGAGKTTLLNTISGLVNATAGSVVMNGEDVTGLPTYRRTSKGLCHIPEGRGIFRSLTVRDNLRMQALPGKEAETVDRATAVFPVLGDRLTQAAGTLSGGQQQMLALARAYVRDPELILVDEASLGLAPVLVDAVFEFLTGLASKGVALLIVDQFVTKALDLADTAYVLRRGEIAYSGSPAELLQGDLFSQYLGTA